MELIEGAKADVAKVEPQVDPNAGKVRRVLNFRDRLIIMDSLRAAIAQGGDLKALRKIQKLEEILDDEGATNYFEAFDADFNKRAALWAAAKRDFINNPKDPKFPDPGNQPKRSPEDERGKEATFWIPSKLDAYIQDTLKTAKFAPNQIEFALELADKFKIPIEE